MHHSQTVSKGLVKDGLGKGLCGQIHPFLLSLNVPPHTVRDLSESRAAWKGESLHPQLGMWRGQGFLFLLLVWLWPPSHTVRGK